MLHHQGAPVIILCHSHALHRATSALRHVQIGIEVQLGAEVGQGMLRTVAPNRKPVSFPVCGHVGFVTCT